MSKTEICQMCDNYSVRNKCDQKKDCKIMKIMDKIAPQLDDGAGQQGLVDVGVDRHGRSPFASGGKLTPITLTQRRGSVKRGLGRKEKNRKKIWQNDAKSP